MQKIILTHSNVGLVVGRLQKLMKGSVIASQNIYNEKPSQVKRSKVFSDTSCSSYLVDSKVIRHPYSYKENILFSSFDKTPLVHIAIHSCAGMAFSEGDVFYFYGPMIVIEEKSRSIGKDRVVCKLQLVQNPSNQFVDTIMTGYRKAEEYGREYARQYEKDYWRRYEERYQ